MMMVVCVVLTSTTYEMKPPVCIILLGLEGKKGLGQNSGGSMTHFSRIFPSHFHIS
jgi:hypothetical protein